MNKDIDIKVARVERQKPEIQIEIGSNFVLRERDIINAAQNADNWFRTRFIPLILLISYNQPVFKSNFDNKYQTPKILLLYIPELKIQK